MFAVDHNIAGCVDFQNPFGNQETQVLFLLNQLRIFVGLHLQDQRICLVECLKRVFKISFLPEILRDLQVVKGFVQVRLNVFFLWRRLPVGLSFCSRLRGLVGLRGNRGRIDFFGQDGNASDKIAVIVLGTKGRIGNPVRGRLRFGLDGFDGFGRLTRGILNAEQGLHTPRQAEQQQNNSEYGDEAIQIRKHSMMMGSRPSLDVDYRTRQKLSRVYR